MEKETTGCKWGLEKSGASQPARDVGWWMDRGPMLWTEERGKLMLVIISMGFSSLFVVKVYFHIKLLLTHKMKNTQQLFYGKKQPSRGKGVASEKRNLGGFFNLEQMVKHYFHFLFKFLRILAAFLLKPQLFCQKLKIICKNV